MTTEEIQKETDRAKLYDRITRKDVRKKERRLLRRKILRIEVLGNNAEPEKNYPSDDLREER